MTLIDADRPPADVELSALVVDNATLLRRLAAGAPGSIAELATALDRDRSNTSKTVAMLRAQNLIAADALALTGQGYRALDAIDFAAGRFTPGRGGRELAVRHADLAADPANPRKVFDEDALAELADSIAEHDLIQPIAVRAAGVEGKHLIVAGERRWRAIGLLIAAGRWAPERAVLVRVLEGVGEKAAALLALVENMQREDLNPIEEAQGFAALRDVHGLSTAEISAKLGKGRGQRHIQDRLQLLQLDAASQQDVADGALSIRDARDVLRRNEEDGKLLALKPDEKLLLGEILDKFERHPKRKNDYYKATECAHDAKSQALSRLKNLHLVDVELDRFGTGRCYIKRGYAAYQFERAGGLDAVPPDERGLYKTPFLNGPFELSPAMAEAQAAKKAEAAKTRADNKAKKERAQRRAEEFARLTAEPPAFAPSAQFDALRRLAAQSKAPLPWRIEAKYGGVLDADGKPIGNFAAGRWDSEADADGIRAVFALVMAAAGVGLKPAEPAPSAADPELFPAAELDGERRFASTDAFAQQIAAASEGA